MSPQALGLAILAASEVPNFLAGMLPSLMTIQRFGADERDLAALRRGELIGGGMALAVGVGAALVAESPVPLAATVLVLVAMLAAYEHAIRNPHENARPISEQAEPASESSPGGPAVTGALAYFPGGAV